jgi:hypothetical protein
MKPREFLDTSAANWLVSCCMPCLSFWSHLLLCVLSALGQVEFQNFGRAFGRRQPGFIALRYLITV